MKYHLWAFWSIVKTNIRNCLLSNGDIFSTHGERESSFVVNDINQTLAHVPWRYGILQVIIFLSYREQNFPQDFLQISSKYDLSIKSPFSGWQSLFK